MNKKNIFLISTLLLGFLTSCDKKKDFYNKNLNENEEIVLNIIYPNHNYNALQLLADDFEIVHKNATVNIICLEGDYNNGIFNKVNNKEIDLYLIGGITEKANTDLINSAVDLNQREDFLINKTNNSLNKCNLTANNNLFTLPLLVDFSGLYVNDTLLKEYNLSTPKTYDEFVSCCETLKQNNIIPIASNITRFANNFLMPYSNNLVINDNELRNDLLNKTNLDKIISKYENSLNIVENMVNNRYYDYKALESQKFTENNIAIFKNEYIADNVNFASAFIGYFPDSNGVYTKQEGLNCPFMFGTASEIHEINNLKRKIGIDFDYTFMPALVSNDGKNPISIRSTWGLSVSNSISDLKKDWAIEFLNYLYDHIETFAEYEGCLPNSYNLDDYIVNKYGIDKSNIANSGNLSIDDEHYYNIFRYFYLLMGKDNASKYTRLEKVVEFDLNDENLVANNVVLDTQENEIVKVIYNGKELTTKYVYSDDEFFDNGYAFFKAYKDDDGVEKTFATRINTKTNKVYILKSTNTGWNHEHYIRKLKDCIKNPNRFCYDAKKKQDNSTGWVFYDIEDVIYETK